MHGPVAPLLGLWHTGQILQGTQGAAAADTSLCGASEQMLGGPDSIHPIEENRKTYQHKNKPKTEEEILHKTSELSKV